MKNRNEKQEWKIKFKKKLTISNKKWIMKNEKQKLTISNKKWNGKGKPKIKGNQNWKLKIEN